VPRDHQDRRGRLALHDPIEHFEAIHAGHLDVEKDRVHRVRVELRERGLTVRRRRDGVPLVLENHPQRVADVRLVVDDQNALGHRSIDPNFRSPGSVLPFHF
jgi:hypothetical protein